MKKINIQRDVVVVEVDCSLYKTRLTCVAVVGLRCLTLADVG